MSRIPRMVVPGVPLHITQRGVDRCRTFHEDEELGFYRWALQEAIAESGCTVHAYALMSNHVHLLATPPDLEAPSRMMRALGCRYVRFFNRRHRRTGTLWEGRFRSSLVRSASYLFACSRYIELNAVRAGIVAEPREYRWSSYHHNASGLHDPLLAEHWAYTALGDSRAKRCAAYQAMFASGLTDDIIASLRAAQCGRSRIRATANEQQIEAILAPADRRRNGGSAAERHRRSRATLRRDRADPRIS